MSRVVRQQLFQELGSMQEANRKIAGLLRNEEYQEVINQLADCQQQAIAIGNKIEQLCRGDAESIRCLEEYCERAFQLAEETGDYEKHVRRYEALTEQLRKVEKGMENDIPDRLEIAFFPYKVSMWDALESIWFAATRTDSCEVYVVPIPYFDKNPDGSPREEHYEGMEYPDYVPITDYNEYDPEIRHPDIIFIHNPYDNWNHVTSVFPRFYCKNLKQFTEQLVYVPYFVLEEIDPSEQEKIDGMKSFCFLPGIIYADKVIVQSENMRLIYINEFLKMAGEHDIKVDRKYLKKKILGLGSPKFDKTEECSGYMQKVPESWLRLIRKPDGKIKKIVFYNTSVKALLEDDEKIVKKIEWVFQIFKAHSADMVLLWRPHPLVRATLEGMRPQLWKRYNKIVERYREESWGIYDDTPDVHCAVSLCDAYYGDPSSVVQLINERKKMVLLQNPDILHGRREGYYTPCAFLIKGDMCWFSAMNYNGLYCLNRMNGRLSFMGGFPEEDLNIYEMHFDIVEYKMKLFFIPFNGSHVSVYDIAEKEMRTVRLPQGQVRGKFVKGIKKDEYLYLMPGRYEQIVRINMETEKITKLFKLSVYDAGRNEDGYFSDAGSVMDGDNIYFPMADTGFIMKMNLNTGEIDKIDLSSHVRKIQSLCSNDGVFWILDDRGRFLHRYSERFLHEETYDITELIDSATGGEDICTDFLFRGEMMTIAPCVGDWLINIPCLKGKPDIGSFKIVKTDNFVSKIGQGHWTLAKNEELWDFDFLREKWEICENYCPQSAWCNMVDKYLTGVETVLTERKSGLFLEELFDYLKEGYGAPKQKAGEDTGDTAGERILRAVLRGEQ